MLIKSLNFHFFHHFITLLLQHFLFLHLIYYIIKKILLKTKCVCMYVHEKIFADLSIALPQLTKHQTTFPTFSLIYSISQLMLRHSMYEWIYWWIYGWMDGYCRCHLIVWHRIDAFSHLTIPRDDCECICCFFCFYSNFLLQFLCNFFFLYSNIKVNVQFFVTCHWYL